MSDRKRLGSWKEIAAHLHVETRTAMRWENDRALPVHRVPGGGRAAVFAYADEIDAWLHGQPAASLKEDAAAQPDAARGPNEISAAAEPVTPPFDPTQGKRRMTRGAAIALMGALAVVALLVLVVVWRGGGEREVVRVSFAGEKLIAWDAAGREVWSKEFPGLLQEAHRGVWNETTPRVLMADIDGDGQKEIVAVSHARGGTEGDDLLDVRLRCFSSAGQPKWEYQPQDTLRFAKQEFGGPWIIHDVFVAAEGPGRGIWLAVNHNTWWPSFVVRLDANGHAEIRFVNSGSIWALNLIETPRGTFLLAGGVNNEPYAGALAVLDVNAAPAVSPQDPAGEFHCENCPSVSPVAYFVLPRSEVNLKWPDQSHNGVFVVRKEGQEARVMTVEAGPAALGLYRFTAFPESRPAGMDFSDGYWNYHRQLEQEGKLNHSAAQCPDRTQPKLVRRWTPATGWTVVSVPSVPLN